VSTVAAPPQGLSTLVLGNVDITAEVTSGRLGGLLLARDVMLPGYLQKLDNLAFSVGSKVNALHAAGFDLNGAAGGNVFSLPAAAAGAAATIALAPALVADPSKIAAAGRAAPGDNQTARAIAALVNGSPGPVDDWASLVHQVGGDRSNATSDLATRTDVLNQLETLRTQISGVSIDEEAATMLKFQRAYEANARFFSVVDRLLDEMMNSVA
jgi:flagellar hook-associated protein 1 FlgK